MLNSHETNAKQFDFGVERGLDELHPPARCE